MPKHHGAAAQEIVEVVAPGEVVEVGALRFLDDELEIVRGVVAAEHTAGEAALGSSEQR